MDLLNLVINWLLKPSLILVLFLSLAYLARRASAASRHYLLATAAVCLLLLPVATYFLPSWSLPILPVHWAEQILLWHVSTELLTKIIFVYLFGVSWVLLYLLLGIVSLWQVTARAKTISSEHDIQLLEDLRLAMGIQRPIKLLLCTEIASPQVWGVICPAVMLPGGGEQWSAERKRFVLIHELAHVARWDWPLTILVKISCALFWFLPLSWYAARKMAQAAEMACDDFVYRLRFDIDRQESTEYADNLLQLARTEQNSKMDAALQINNGSPVYQRVISLLDIQRQRECLNSDQKGWTLLLGIILLLSLASVNAVVQPVMSMNLERYMLLKPLFIEVEEGRTLTQQQSLAVPNLSQLQNEKILSVAAPEPSEVVIYAEQYTHNYRSDLTPILAMNGEVMNSEATLAIDLADPQVSVQGYLPQRVIVPRYPRKALHLGIEGDVTVEFSINEAGLVSAPNIIHAEPKGVFEREVLLALQQFRYSPQKLGGQAVVVTELQETFNFRLRDRKDFVQ